MLVLSRKVGERIHVGEDIVLEVRRISGNRVTLALEAPRDVRILRGELEKAAKEFDPPKFEANPLITGNGGVPLGLVQHLAHAGASDYAV